MCYLSIITVNLNNDSGLRKTVESVVSQTYNNFEFIIIDGGSKDQSTKVIEEFSEKITYWISEQDSGVYNAMNKGIKKAKGKYCLFLNSGDYLLSNNVLEKLFYKEPNEDIIIGRMKVTKDGKLVHTTHSNTKLTLRYFFSETIPHQATFVKKHLFENYGFFSENYKIHSDLEFWLKTIILNDCTYCFTNIIVSVYNLEGMSSDSRNQKLSNEEVNRIFENLFPKRIIDDYMEFKKESGKLKVFNWWKSKKIFYIPVLVIFKITQFITSFIKK